MGVNYESLSIGTVRATNINGQKGLGISELRFVLAWNLFPKRTDVFTVFGTSIWVSSMADGETVPVILGQAMPETAWCEETREGQPFDRHVMYRLTLPSPQLLALEQMRQGRGLVFVLNVRGNSYGPLGVRAFDDTLRMPVNVSEWVRVLKESHAADVLLVGIHLPIGGANGGARAAIDLVRRANEHLVFGQYTAAVAECRRAIESLWKSANLTEQARAARKLLSTMNDQISMTKRDRELALGEAVRIFCHVAHHVGSDAEPEIFSRIDAALAVSATAALVSSLVAASDLIRSSDTVKNVDAREVPTLAESAAGAKKQDILSLAAQVTKVREHLKNNPKNRPGTMKRLRSALDSLFGKKLDAQGIHRLIEELIKRGVVTEAASKLAYADSRK